MKTTTIIIDDFYNNPLDVREFALKQEFSVVGNYPGFRTKSHTNPSIYSIIQEAVKHAGGQITNFSTDSHNGSYQYATSKDKSWIHADEQMWAGICFLTPDAPLSSGTGLFKLKENGVLALGIGGQRIRFVTHLDVSKEMVDRVCESV